jgi:phosphatidylethanolamine/phosphatidyl-N-methylethanolamine N-methyltransferase
VHVVQGDAFDLKKTLGNGNGETFAAIVSGLPLLNHPVERRRALIEGALAKLKPGAPYVQFSYGFEPPIPAPAGSTVSRAALVLMNLPPARVWVYRKTV